MVAVGLLTVIVGASVASAPAANIGLPAVAVAGFPTANAKGFWIAYANGAVITSGNAKFNERRETSSPSTLRSSAGRQPATARAIGSSRATAASSSYGNAKSSSGARAACT